MEKIILNGKKLVAIRYEPLTFTLELEFRNQGIIRYFGIPGYIFENLKKASSKEDFVNRYIKNAGYSYEKL